MTKSTSTSEQKSPSTVTSQSSKAVVPSRKQILDDNIDEVELRKKITIPQYLRQAMSDAIKQKNPAATGRGVHSKCWVLGELAHDVPVSPIVFCVNTKSGGKRGIELMEMLQVITGFGQVFDLSVVKPTDFVNLSLGCLDELAKLGDNCAKGVRENLRIVVAGGDGTVGSVLRSLEELFKKDVTVPPVAILPLGTGNELSRTFGWGGSLPSQWQFAVKQSLQKAANAPICHLDSWHVLVSMPKEGNAGMLHSPKHMQECVPNEDVICEGVSPESVLCFKGVFYNYFSTGMDAELSYGSHLLRNTKPYISLSNKLLYSVCGCAQGWFCTKCVDDQGSRRIKRILCLHYKKANGSEWEQLIIPYDVRSIVVLNNHNYGNGRNPWGHPKTEYCKEKGFVEPQVDDGVLEILGFKHGWHASFVMAKLIDAKHLAQASEIKFELRGCESKNHVYMQTDGEPWKHELTAEFSTFVHITRVPHYSLMISGE